MRELIWRLRAMLRRRSHDGRAPRRSCSSTTTWRSRPGCAAGCRRTTPARARASRRPRVARRRVDARGDGRPLARRRGRRPAPCRPRADPQSRLRRRWPSLVLAASVAINTLIFFMLEGVVLRPLPYRIARTARAHLRGQSTTSRSSRCRSAAFSTIAPTRASLEAIALYTGRDMELSGADGRSRAADRRGHHLRLLLRARQGAARSGARSPTPICAGGTPHAILSHRLWRDRFQSDPAIVGKAIRLDRTPWTIVGVAPAGLPARRRRVPLAAAGRERRRLAAARRRPRARAGCAARTSATPSRACGTASPRRRRAKSCDAWPPRYSSALPELRRVARARRAARSAR